MGQHQRLRTATGTKHGVAQRGQILRVGAAQLHLVFHQQDRACAPFHQGPALEVKRGAGTILLVEDEVELRGANAEYLTSLGYSVLCAGSGPEALMLAHEAGQIDLVISDVVMPKMNGREFADRLLKLRPSAKLLFVSGYAADVVLQTGISSQGMPFLQKPYSFTQLRTKFNPL